MFKIGVKQDLTGKIYNNWKVLYKDENKIDKNTRWICECRCENKTIKSVSTHDLTSGISKSCGCQSNYGHLEGRIFGNLKVLKNSGQKSRDDSILWECECQCENKTILLLNSQQLKNRKNLSCGCQELKRKTIPYKNLTGLQFGNWKVLKEDKRGKNGEIRWLCECQCKDKTIRSLKTYALTSGESKSCGCFKRNNLNGMIFGRWKVLQEDGIDDYGNIKWICECQCEAKTIKSIISTQLTQGITISCGCSTREKKRKYNTYDLTGEYGVGWATNTNKEFYFDLEDYNLIKNWCWIEDKRSGYITTRESRTTTHKVISMHRMIMNITDNEIEVDHIYHITCDNRKSQLRLVNKSQNQQNREISIHNTSGVKGISWSKKENKWRVYITLNRKRIEKRFKEFEDAVSQRKEWEEKYFGEYNYQKPPQEYIAELVN